MSISGISDGGEGILTSTANFRINRRSLGFTWSCPKDEDENPISGISDVSGVLDSFGESKWVIAEELHENGKRHYHADVTYHKAIDCKNPRGFDVCGVHPNIIKPHKGGKWKEYCMKTNNFEANYKTRRPIKLIEPTLDWEVEILDIISKPADDRTIHWYWSDAGNIGKTSFCKYLTCKHDALALHGKGDNVRNGVITFLKDKGYHPDLVVFPIPRSYDKKFLNYESLENIKDMYFYSGKYEGGMVCGPCPHLFVFANEEPDLLKMSADRWVIKRIG